MGFQGLLLFVPILLFSVIAHEYAHGYAALKQGDNTALAAGRLTWNPIKHIDPWMTVLLPVLLYYLSRGTVVLGGAKPVPVDPRNYRNYRRGDIIVSLDGHPTTHPDQVLELLAGDVVGKNLPVELVRGGRHERAELRIEERPRAI